jgi:hypothetical protein
VGLVARLVGHERQLYASGEAANDQVVSLARVTRPAPHRLPAWLVTVVLVTAALVGGARPVAAPAQASTRSAADTEDLTPLRVSIETLTPGTVPRRGPVTLTGRIFNRSEDTWSDLNVYLLTSAAPLRTRAELADAAASDADSEVGDRLAQEGQFTEVGDLAPGAAVSYRLSVPRADLTITGRPGVYWVGVHVLGASTEGRDLRADGRARTFMPLLPAPGTAAAVTTRTRLALLVPVKKPVQRGSAGRVVDTGSWADTLGPDGRLDRLLSLTARARRPVTMVVDPAVLDAVQSLGRGNPTADPAPGAGADPGASPTPRPTGGAGGAEGSPAAGTSTPSVEASGGEADETSAARTTRRARSWLAEIRRQAPTHTVATVPYGDLDVAAALQGGMGSVYRLGTTLSSQVLTGLGMQPATPVVDPPTGYLPEAALRRLDPGTTVVLRDEAVPGAAGSAVRRSGGPTVVLTDTAAEQGGPQPNSQFAALAVRQRLLGEAALHALSPDRDEPLVVSLPDYWNPGESWNTARFFGGLDTSWLTMVDLPTVAAAAAPAGPGDAVSYPEEDRRARLPQANLQATRSLVTTAGVFDRLLTAPDPVDQPLQRIAMLASSSAARANPDLAVRLAGGTTAYVRSQMAQVRVEGPQFVMMSGESGPIQVTLVNGLPQSVTVGVTVSTPGSAPGAVRIDDVEPVTLGAGQRTSVRLQARSDDIGVHAVSLTPTDGGGVPLGTSTQLSIRTSNVSTVIWVIMAVGGGLLFLAIAIRLLRRVRLRRATHGPRLSRERGA